VSAVDLSANEISAAAARIMARCGELRSISASPASYERLYLTPEHRAAAEKIRGWMAEAGLAARMDAAGNLIGRRDGADPTNPALVLASHFDTVRDAGTYDGQLGVVTAIETASALRALGTDFPFPLEVHAYADEEGTRFHTMLLGSGFLTGLEGPETLARVDHDGISISEAMRRFGLDPERIGGAQRHAGEFRAYLEVHIEQGPVLEAEDLAVGTVTAIAGQIRGTVKITGLAGHAGTVPMAMRRDALAGAAKAVLAIEDVARSHADPLLVATVGEIRAEPGASNVIPGEVRLTLDLRSGNDEDRQAALKKLRRGLDEIAGDRGLQIELEVASDTPAVRCHPDLIAAIDAASEAVQGTPIHLTSGAGHDAIAMAALCPVGMIFVRCKGGISHNPAESITEADAGAGFAALTRTVLRLMGKG
jgi:allantoate deiminase